MKYGMNLLLWTGDVTEEHFPLLEKIKGWGFDGVELPFFDLTPEKYAKVGGRPVESGQFHLRPHWRQDYLAETRQLLEWIVRSAEPASEPGAAAAAPGVLVALQEQG